MFDRRRLARSNFVLKSTPGCHQGPNCDSLGFVSKGVRQLGDEDIQGSAATAATDRQSEAPFNVSEARVSSSNVGSWLNSMSKRLGLDGKPALAGVAVGLAFFAAFVAVTAFNGDGTETTAPTADVADHNDDGSRSSFTDGGLFNSDAPKKRSRAAGAAGKEAALAERGTTASTAGNSSTDRNAGELAMTDPAGPATSVDDVNVGAVTPGPNNANDGPTGTSSARSRSTLTTARSSSPGPIPPAGRPTTTRSFSGGVVTSTPTSLPGSSYTTVPRYETYPPTTNTTSTTVRVTTASTSVTSYTTTTRSTTTTRPTTSSTTTTTAAPVTPPTGAIVDDGPLIAAPANGASFKPSDTVTFAANPVSGADEYCWTFAGSGVSAFTRCASSTTYSLDLGLYDFNLGAIGATARAYRGTTLLKSDSVTIGIINHRVLTQPRDGSRATIGRQMRVGFVGVDGATYCFRLSQPGFDSGEICTASNGTKFDRSDALWSQVSPGPLRIDARIVIAGSNAGTQSVTIDLVD